MTAAFYVLLAILGLSVLVIVHESGHYLVARMFGMKVLRFSIGLGPTLFRYQPKDSPTVFQVCAVPFLAYVQIAGMHPGEDIDPKDKSLFPNASLTARMLTIVAGPLANYLAASLIVFAVGMYGWPQETPSSPMTVGMVSEGTPAAAAGLRAGDIIVEANGQAIDDVDGLIAATAPRGGSATEYLVKRASGGSPPAAAANAGGIDAAGQAMETLRLTITPEVRDGRGVIGVTAVTKREYVPMGLAEAARAAVVFPVELTVVQLEGFADLFARRSTEGLTGPVGMGKLVAEQAQQGVVEYLMMLMLLSVALGMFNLLPFPALDGGRLVFLGYELVTRRRPNARFEAIVHTVGLLFFLSVLVLVTFRDVMSGSGGG